MKALMQNLGSDESSAAEDDQITDEEEAVVAISTVQKSKQDNSFENRGSLHNLQEGYY